MTKKESTNSFTPSKPDAGSEQENFLSRWSRLKAAERAGIEPEPSGGDPSHVVADASATDPPGPREEPELTDADMPPLESLSGESDVSGFLAKGVSEGLRRAALRKLFHSPKFNVCDGLDDYCDDFTNFAPLGSTITADMRHHMERIERFVKDRLDESPDDAGESTESEQFGAVVEPQLDVARSPDDGLAEVEDDGKDA